ncbi:hypothetical protein Poli38472_002428 [Pythium oligandrum]|uniref:DUF2423 domain-containing protein n=1 Tax=Pythium oligandrum TaxID=41045 RepID=A0A8K1CHH8_PYTOL|nr:hypothetical protein Poli38472_002428 [Pythium oligandrum]|eukprot:TMW63487.1 hypothetical protein Poli38472_002428 [Pythium oligandrum]
MAKSLRSKIKRKFRTELRQRIGVPHQAVQEAKIQDNLRKAIEAQTGGKSVLGLKQMMGTVSAPVAVAETDGMEVDAGSLAQTEAQLLNDAGDKKKLLKKKKPANKRKKKFLHFHPLRKKGV